MSGSPWEDDGHCYICGTNNAEGMKLSFVLGDDSIETSFMAEKRHQGYRDVLHGGILAMVMDEVMVLLPYRLFGSVVATAEMTVKLLKPVPIGGEVRVRARFSRPARPGQRLYLVEAEAVMEDGSVAGTATGKCVRVK